MIPASIVRYLAEHAVPYEVLRHPRAVTGSELAQAMHVTGHIVAKTVVIDAGGRRWIAVLPATEVVDPQRVMSALGTSGATLVPEQELSRIFADCELGAAPPFGGLYGLPVIADTSFNAHAILWFRGGNHEESIGMHWVDYLDLEAPTLAAIGAMPEWGVAEMHA